MHHKTIHLIFCYTILSYYDYVVAIEYHIYAKHYVDKSPTYTETSSVLGVNNVLD